MVPEEIVQDSEFMGESKKFKGIIQGEHMGRLANVIIKIGAEKFPRQVVAVPGKDISWTAAMSFDMGDLDELLLLHHHLYNTRQLPEEETHFLPPSMEQGKLRGAVTVTQDIVVAEEEMGTQEEYVDEATQTVDLEPRCEEEQENVSHARVEEFEAEVKREESLVEGREESSGFVEAEADVVQTLGRRWKSALRVPIHRPRTCPRKMTSWLLCIWFTLFCLL